jgi:hypothetical protein
VRIQSAVRSPLEASRVSIIRGDINVLLWISCLPWSKPRSLFREYVCLQLKYMRSSLESHEGRQSQLQGMMPNMRFMQKTYCTPSLGKRLATLRWSLRTQILVIIASTALVWYCRNMCVQLSGRLELPQLTKASGERPQEFTLKRGLFNKRTLKKGITYLDSTRFGTRKTGLFEMPFLLVELGKKGKFR